MELKNQVAILIGLNDVGIAVAKGLLDEGATLVVADKNQKNVDEVLEHAKSTNRETLGIICDATQEEQVQVLIKKTIEDFGKIEILVTNFWWSKLMPFVD
jgi:NAD(P)-dependent dehydrogenase (short-subunit alcohol dehydrogenase family)